MLSGAENFRKPEDVDAKLARIERLQGADPGIFVLAVHAFVEGWIRDSFDYQMANVSFGELVENFISHCKDAAKACGDAGGGSSGAVLKGLVSIDALKHSHHETDYVRHRFHGLPRSNAEAATQHLDVFCRLAGIGSPERLEAIRNYLAAWDVRKPMGALVEENTLIRSLVKKESEENKSLADQVAELTLRAAVVDNLEASLKATERQLAEVLATSGARNEKIDALRGEKARALFELKEARGKLDQLADARDYVDALLRMTVFTRTRSDYERAVVRLTAEQKAVLSQINLDRDFLVKGSAGTGKTLVLLKAVEKAKGLGTGKALLQDTLELDEVKGSVALLTYTTTMVKYDAFLASLMSSGRMVAADRISTADSFLLERLKALDPKASIDWNGKTLLELASRFSVAGLEPRELAAEVENFIWANDVGMDEYVTHLMDRKGMRKALPKAARYSAWVAAESIALEMEAAGSYTRNYAALKLVHAAADGDASDGSASGAANGGAQAPSVDYVFIDEAQDLPAVVLKALKQAARRCVLLAGDADQSIYQPGFSFRRTGIDTGGRTRILRSNFRNTVQIHELAERYRSIDSCHDHENAPEAFRDGPVPELFRAQDRKALLELLVLRLRLFIETLGYEAQNIGILVPANDDITFIRERLQPLGIPLVNIREPDFAFDSTGQVRSCTLHSAKGLDFPVVLLFLDRPPFFGSGYDEESVDRMSANLVYVALTRAMDHLNVFALDKPDCHALENLVRAFDA
ncbi:MAG: 3'-5' exonuclease [Spirochaetia bacterium]|jgi:hypothetical protein|nr:3'-5' exonuclease [Spirochaetia bacterium]